MGLKDENSNLMWDKISQIKTYKEFLTWANVRKASHKYFIEDFIQLKKLIQKDLEYFKLYFGDAIDNDQELFYQIYYRAFGMRSLKGRLPTLDHTLILESLMKHIYGDEWEKNKKVYYNGGDTFAYKEIKSELNKVKLTYFYGLINKFEQINFLFNEQSKLRKEVDFSMGFPFMFGTNLYRFWIPVINLGILNPGDEVQITNPRSKKIDTYEIIERREYDSLDGYFYSAILNNKIVYIVDYNTISQAYTNLFDDEKSLYCGWWNRRLIKN